MLTCFGLTYLLDEPYLLDTDQMAVVLVRVICLERDTPVEL
jgi:hypothetical protein